MNSVTLAIHYSSFLGELPLTFQFVGPLCFGKAFLPEYRQVSVACKIETFQKVYVCEAWMFPTPREFIRYWSYERSDQDIRYLYSADEYFDDTCG